MVEAPLFCKLRLTSDLTLNYSFLVCTIMAQIIIPRIAILISDSSILSENISRVTDMTADRNMWFVWKSFDWQASLWTKSWHTKIDYVAFLRAKYKWLPSLSACKLVLRNIFHRIYSKHYCLDTIDFPFWNCTWFSDQSGRIINCSKNENRLHSSESS